MGNENILKKIQLYFLQYPNLDKDGRIYANFLPVESVNYGIMEIPSENGGVVQSFVSGDEIIQFQFEFDTRLDFSKVATNKNWDNSTWLNELIAWITKQNRLGNLPDIKNVQSIEVVRTPYAKMLDNNGSTVVHSFSARVTYYKEFDIFNIQTKEKKE